MMTQPKKYLLYILVLCTLGYGSAWAYDIHAVESEYLDTSDRLIPVYANSGDHFPDQTATAPDQTTTICDHSCHAYLHMLAIVLQNTYLLSWHKTSQRPNSTPEFISLIVSPDRRPPRT